MDVPSCQRIAPPSKKVWQALTDPAHLRGWAPFEADGHLDKAGSMVNLTWSGMAATFETKVTRVEAPKLLEYGDLRWELEATNVGTRLTRWHSIDRRFISWDAAGWHICFDVLDHLLSGSPVERIAGAAVMKLNGWQRLNAEYAEQFRVENSTLPPIENEL